jgi:hypothetical protein
MSQEVELSEFDLRYESFRIQHKGAEGILLTSILEQGIREPIEGVDVDDRRILLNGFKRYRCAKKLSLHVVPYVSIGSDEVLGIIRLLRTSNDKSLTILEQAKLVDELKNVHKLSHSEIAQQLERSKAWVSVRTGIVAEMSENVLQKIFSDTFPAYAYMYTLRQFIRINRVSKKEVDEFVNAVAGKKLSIRDIERLAHGYFKGSEELRDHIKNGNIVWGLNRLKDAVTTHATDCNEHERGMIRDLEITQKYLQKLTHKSTDDRFKSKTFFAQANLLAGGILRQVDMFTQRVKEFYAKSGQT